MIAYRLVGLMLMLWQPAFRMIAQGSTNNPDQDSVRTYLFPEIVITASRRERDAFETGRSISVLPADQINLGVFHSVGEALGRIEGMYIVGAGQHPGAIQNMFMRGSNANHTTIMVDDTRITDPSSPNNATDLSELSLANIERVEIVRGSQGTLYGSSAIGGVVNMVTRKSQMPGIHADAEIRGGVFSRGGSLFSQNLFLNYTLPKGFYGNASLAHTGSHGMDATLDTVTNPNTFNKRDKDGFDKTDLQAKLGFRDNVWDLYASYSRTHHQADVDKGAYRDDDNYTVDFRRNLFTYGAAYRVNDNLKVRCVGGISTMGRTAVDDSSVVDYAGTTDHTFSENNYKGSTSNHEILTNIIAPGVGMTVGAGLYEETMGARTYFYTGGPFGAFAFTSDLDTLHLKSTSRSVFAHLDVSGGLAGEALRGAALSLGVRWNRHSSYGTAMTYEVGPGYTVGDDVLLYASYSTGFNAPSLYQLFAPGENYLSGIKFGNDNLKAETSRSWEFGCKYRPSRRVSVSASYFRTVVDNAIEYVYLWDGNIGIDTLGNDFMRDDFRGDTYLNLGTLTTNGFELVVFAELTNNLSCSGNISLVSGRLEYSPSDIDVARTRGNHVQLFNNGAFVNKHVEVQTLVRRPNTFNMAVQYAPVTEITARLDIRHVGSRSDVFYDSQLGPFGALGTLGVDQYTIVDLTMSCAVTTNVRLTGRIENLFNVEYQEIKGFSTRGRGGFVSARYTL
jgi:vitamin B12 transporter